MRHEACLFFPSLNCTGRGCPFLDVPFISQVVETVERLAESEIKVEYTVRLGE